LLEACRDKRAANDLARAAGLDTPETCAVADVESLCSFAEEVGYPVIVKPVRSSSKLFGRKAYILRSEQECSERFAVWPVENDELLVQRYVAGRLEQCDYVAVDGALTCFFQAHTIRTDRPDGTGFGVDFLSDPVDEDVLDACRAFARAHRYTGPGLLQLVRSTADGRLYFIENNPRLAAGTALAVKCGVDLPYLMLQAAMGTTASTPPPISSGAATLYETGHRTHWLSRDLNGYLDMRRELSAAERHRWRRAILDSHVRAHDHMTWDATDPAPSFLIYRRLLSRLFRRVAGGA
jgi:biotin carboxylase